MRTTMLSVLAVGLVAATAGAGGDATARDRARLQGHWTVVLMEEKGNKAPDELLQTMAVEIKDDRIIVREMGELVVEFGYKLDATRKPGTIDLTYLTGDEKGQVELGIYQIEGPTVKFCTSEKGKSRPTAFGSSRDDDRTVVVIRRKK
jgi:uncharacterized protein (TIGR03067 family)